MDGGMVSEETLEFLQSGKRRYIIGTPRSQLHNFEQALLSQDWEQIQDGLEVKRCSGSEGTGVFVLCRSQDRAQERERAPRAF